MVQITLDYDDILNEVYSRSAIHVSYNPSAPLLTVDNARLLEQRIGDAVKEFTAALSGYVAFVNINPNSDGDNIYIVLALQQGLSVPRGVASAISDVTVKALSSRVLSAVYEPEGNGLYTATWRAATAQVAVMLARVERGVAVDAYSLV